MRLVETLVGGSRSLCGGTGEQLMYLHGGGGLHHDPSLKLLADGFRVVALELPGFGRSTDEPASFEEAATVVRRSLDALAIERCTLVGTSLGAVVALYVALAEPERVDALVLLSPAAFRPADWRPPADLERALFARADGPRPDPPEPAVAERQGRLLGRLFDGLDEPALRARLPELRVPTLVVCGTEDGLFPPAQGRTYRELMPNCSYVLLYDAAHELGWDRPEALAGLVGEFARRREAFVVGREAFVVGVSDGRR